MEDPVTISRIVTLSAACGGEVLGRTKALKFPPSSSAFWISSVEGGFLNQCIQVKSLYLDENKGRVPILSTMSLAPLGRAPGQCA